MKKLALAAAMLISFNVDASLTCDELINWDGPPLEKLAQEAKLNHYSRYEDDVWYYLCAEPSEAKHIDMLIDDGFVSEHNAKAIAKVLGKSYKIPKRTEAGKEYEKIYAILVTQKGYYANHASEVAEQYRNSLPGSDERKNLDKMIYGISDNEPSIDTNPQKNIPMNTDITLINIIDSIPLWYYILGLWAFIIGIASAQAHQNTQGTQVINNITNIVEARGSSSRLPRK